MKKPKVSLCNFSVLCLALFCLILIPARINAFSNIQEDLALVEKGQIEIDNVFFFTKHTKNVTDDKIENLPADTKSYWGEDWIDAWYGVSAKLNLRLILPLDWWSFSSVDNSVDPPVTTEEGANGLTDARLAAKYLITDDLSIFGGLKLSNGDKVKSLGTGENEPFLYLIYKLPVKPVDLILSSGYQYNKDLGTFNYSLIANYAVNEKLEVVSEFIFDRTEPGFNQFSIAPGVTYGFSDSLYAGLSLQVPLMYSGNTDEGFDFMPALGIYFVK